MTSIYSARQRALQDRLDTRRLADFIEAGLVHDIIAPEEKAFIESRDMFFLSTVDGDGQPTVSYKGGAPGFVRVREDNTIAFPSYDGNGMFLSLGNISESGKVGLLFIDFEKPHRLRVHGTATIARDDPDLDDFPEAQFMVRVTPTTAFLNRPRYIHKRVEVEASKYVPRKDRPTPVPGWKRIDIVQDALPACDRGKAEQAGGLLSREKYMAKVGRGEG
jgi:predicted pyridoxine 5'-phosphate oxidase superfamily flavin-nucleotide-binding protein